MKPVRTRSGLIAALAGAAVAAACVTINVYFPAAAAEKAADRIIDDVWSAAPKAPAAPATTPEAAPSPQSALPAAQRVALAALDWLVPPAAAQQQPNLDLSSPEISRLKTQMENRYADLKPLFDAGTVGLTQDGYVAVRDQNAVPLASRNTVRTLVANENADRAALYREIATANGQPQWESQIRGVFAQRWIAKAQAGWWYQAAGGQWQRK